MRRGRRSWSAPMTGRRRSGRWPAMPPRRCRPKASWTTRSGAPCCDWRPPRRAPATTAALTALRQREGATDGIRAARGHVPAAHGRSGRSVADLKRSGAGDGAGTRAARAIEGRCRRPRGRPHKTRVPEGKKASCMPPPLSPCSAALAQGNGRGARPLNRLSAGRNRVRNGRTQPTGDGLRCSERDRAEGLFRREGRREVRRHASAAGSVGCQPTSPIRS